MTSNNWLKAELEMIRVYEIGATYRNFQDLGGLSIPLNHRKSLNIYEHLLSPLKPLGHKLYMWIHLGGFLQCIPKPPWVSMLKIGERVGTRDAQGGPQIIWVITLINFRNVYHTP